jgi:hypothetical protein
VGITAGIGPCTRRETRRSWWFIFYIFQSSNPFYFTRRDAKNLPENIVDLFAWTVYNLLYLLVFLSFTPCPYPALPYTPSRTHVLLNLFYAEWFYTIE